MDLWTTLHFVPSCPQGPQTLRRLLLLLIVILFRCKEVVLFSIIKWCCFQLLKNKLNQPSGALFDYKMVLFSFDKNNRIKELVDAALTLQIRS